MLNGLRSQTKCKIRTMKRISVLAAFMLFASSSALSATNIGSRVALKDLDEKSFRHPLDRDLTSFVKSVPFIGLPSDAIRRSFTLVEQGLRLDLLSSSVKVSSEQLPDLHASHLEACRIMDIDMERPPELYIQSSSVANAYTLALQGKTTPPIVVITSALLDRCSLAEIQAIIGHELGHVKCEHSLYLTLGGLASAPLRNLPLMGASTEKMLERWRLAAEYSCDRAAMLVAQDTTIVNGAMLKLISGTSKYSMNTQAFVAQCMEYEELLKSSNPLVRASVQMQQRTHPLPVRRVAELEKWARSDEYAKILAGGEELEQPMDKDAV